MPNSASPLRKPIHRFQIAQADTGQAPVAGEATHAATVAQGHEEGGKLGEIPAPALLFGNAICIAILMIALANAFRRRALATRVPKGFANFGEWIVESMIKFTVDIIGPGGEKYVPLIGTLFFYILLSNLWGQIPYFHSPTANLSTTLALGLIVFFYVQYVGIRSNGVWGYIKHFAGPVPFAAPLLLIVEVISELVKPFTLAMRLFGNIFGEDTVVVVLAMLAVTMIPRPVAGFVPFQVIISILGLLTAFVQTLVFTLLSCVYISLQSQHDSEHDGQHHAPGHGHYGIEESGLVP